MPTDQERVVLLDQDGRSIGAAGKAEIHHDDTPLHLAFSCYLIHPDSGDVLVTRRAPTKRTWPGTWTNSFCGHPQPFEPIPEAVERRARYELGVRVRDLRLVLPDFRYRAVDASGTVENEVCPVYLGTADGAISANPDEVWEHRWVSGAALVASARLTPWAFSPWMVTQVELLASSRSPEPALRREPPRHDGSRRMSGEHASTASVEAVLDAFFDDRVTRAALTGPAYQRLWEQIRRAAAGGKRVRPQLLLLAHSAFGGRAHADATTAAAAFELLHTALILHDDVLDADLLRRGEPTLRGAFAADTRELAIPEGAATRWGDAAGILAGDLLISAVHTMVSDIAAPHRASLHALIDECLFATAGGELIDVGLSLGTLRANAPEITRMMEAKTAVYSFASPLRAGAVLADAGASAEWELAEIGLLLGFIYQLRDDLLGVFGAPQHLGKSVDSDLREGKRTLLISYVEHTPEWGRVQHLFGQGVLDAADGDRLREALTASGARSRAEAELARQADSARDRIDSAALPDALKAELQAIVVKCGERES